MWVKLAICDACLRDHSDVLPARYVVRDKGREYHACRQHRQHVVDPDVDEIERLEPVAEKFDAGS